MTDANSGRSIKLTENYSGACVQASLTNGELLDLVQQQTQGINGSSLFAIKYRVLPCKISEIQENDSNGSENNYFNLNGQFSTYFKKRRNGKKHKQGGMYHATSIIDFLVNEYKVDRNTFYFQGGYDTFNNNYQMDEVYIDLGNYLSVLFYGGCPNPAALDNPNNLKIDDEDNTFNCFTGAQVYHIPQTTKDAQNLLQQLNKFKLYPIAEATLQMVCHNDRLGFYTSSIRMKKPCITDLKLHYGDEFPNIHEELLQTLQQTDSTGITFLHGPPGMGKTYYLRYLINEIKDKRLIYVPPDLVNDMTKPGFLPFLMQHPNSILIIEDAENIIRDRTEDRVLPNQAVANLLNLSDGLLGDAMHQQIICTFNCDVKGIDPALLRDGRLIIEYKFDKLSAENARRLCIELGVSGNGEDIHEPISLAEVYARKNSTINSSDNEQETQKRTIKKRTEKSTNFFGFYS